MGQLKDLTDREFGRLTVIERAEDYVSPAGHHAVQWLCECLCGNICVVKGASLKNGHTQSCGCAKGAKISAARLIDITNQRFGKLIAIERIMVKGHKTMWKCLCDCGGEAIISSGSLRHGTTKSCGCIRKRKVLNLIGQRFGKWTVLRRGKDGISSSGHPFPQWHCRCDCGTERDVKECNLLRKDISNSCGCQGLIDLVGRKFGRLTVLERAENHIQTNGHSSTQWKCLCSCGNEIVVRGSHLRSGVTNSCGCLCRELSAKRFKEQAQEKHWNWQGGITALYYQIRNTEKYRQWRQSVYEKDSFTCQKCGRNISDTLHAHHKKSRSQIMRENNITTVEEALTCEELWIVDKGDTLCEGCHLGIKENNPQAFHRLYGTRNFTEQNYHDWIKAAPMLEAI